MRRILDKRYELIRCIGQGGMSKVYLAKDLVLDKNWAIKEIHKNNIQYQSAIQEYTLLKELNHPSLCRIVNVIDQKDNMYIVMDHIQGYSLAQILQQRIPSQEEIVQWAKEICEVFIYLHSKDIIYRDMKPGNVMLKEDGHIVLIDFGVARVYKHEKMEDTIPLGTKGYAAPEQFSSLCQSDIRSDIYSFGVTLHHLLTGICPNDDFRILPIRRINPQLSYGLEMIVTKCTQTDPNLRYSCCNEILHDLHHYKEIDKKQDLDIQSYYRRFYRLIFLSVFNFFLSLSFLISYLFLYSSNYENILYQAKTIQDSTLCIQAIQKIPSRSEAYYELIQLYKKDGIFDVEEDKQFKQYVLPTLQSLKDDRSDVLFNIGILYWYYLDYGDFYTAMNLSVNYFEESNDPMAEIYASIAHFYQTIVQYENEGKNDSGEYKYIIKKLEELSKLDTISDILVLQKSQLILSFLESYSHQIKRDGISKQRCLDLYNQSIQTVASITPTTQKNISLKETILKQKTSCLDAIEAAYKEN